MKRVLLCLNWIIIVLLLNITNFAKGQQADSKVMMPSIFGEYSGKSKKGLAQGYGIAQGIDKYEGQFSKGFPHGRGTYTWADGSIYDGQWSDGLKDGKGKLIIPTLKGDSVITGFWRKGKFIGIKFIQPFEVGTNIGVVRYAFHKISEEGNDVIIKIMINGLVNQDIEAYSIAYDSGQEYKSGSNNGLQNVSFPLMVKVRYRTWNRLHTSQSDVVIDFKINESGRWEVVLSN